MFKIKKEWTEKEKQKARDAIEECHGDYHSVRAKLKSELYLNEW